MKDMEVYGGFEPKDENYGYGLVGSGGPVPPDDPFSNDSEADEYVYIFVEEGGKGIKCKIKGSFDGFDDSDIDMYELPDGIHKIYNVGLSTIEVVDWNSVFNVPNETISDDSTFFPVKSTTVMVDLDTFGRIAREIDKSAREDSVTVTLDTRVLKEQYNNKKPNRFYSQDNIFSGENPKNDDINSNKYDSSESSGFRL